MWCPTAGDSVSCSDEAWTEEHDWQRVGVGVRLVADTTYCSASQQPGVEIRPPRLAICCNYP